MILCFVRERFNSQRFLVETIVAHGAIAHVDTFSFYAERFQGGCFKGNVSSAHPRLRRFLASFGGACIDDPPCGTRGGSHFLHPPPKTCGRTLSRSGAVRWWCEHEAGLQAWQRGYCEPAPHMRERDADCTTAARGYWSAVPSAAACEERCRHCARCEYVSYSPEDHDCAWAQSCDLRRLSRQVGDRLTGHCSVQVDRTPPPRERAPASGVGPPASSLLQRGEDAARAAGATRAGDAPKHRHPKLAPGIGSVQVVIASCANDLSWALPLAATLDVLVLEKCTGGVDDLGRPLPQRAEPLPALRYEAVEPNLGREAHSYLWYLVRHWDALQDTTVFLQGDIPRHMREGEILGPSATATESLTANLSSPSGLLRRFHAEGLSFHALSTVLSANTMANAFAPKVHCELFRTFTPDIAPGSACPTWTAFALANFIVSRRAVHRLPRAAYATMLAQLEAAEPKHAADLAVLCTPPQNRPRQKPCSSAILLTALCTLSPVYRRARVVGHLRVRAAAAAR